MPGTTSTEPNNQNYLSPLGFRFQLSRTPKTNYFVQSVTLPSVSLGQFDLDDPFVKLPLPGTKLTYDTLNISFIVNEDMENYLEIYNWLKGLGFPESYSQYSALSSQAPDLAPKATDVYSDASLMVMSSNHNPNIKINFQEMFPISLSDLTFDSTLSDVEYLKATVTFRYRLYTIEKL